MRISPWEREKGNYYTRSPIDSRRPFIPSAVCFLSGGALAVSGVVRGIQGRMLPRSLDLRRGMPCCGIRPKLRSSEHCSLSYRTRTPASVLRQPSGPLQINTCCQRIHPTTPCSPLHAIALAPRFQRTSATRGTCMPTSETVWH
jgi:hypothetical protein